MSDKIMSINFNKQGFSEIWVIVFLVLAIVLFVAWRENILTNLLRQANVALENANKAFDKMVNSAPPQVGPADNNTVKPPEPGAENQGAEENKGTAPTSGTGAENNQPVCGQDGQTCCSTSRACEQELICKNNQCQPLCGGNSQPCCLGGTIKCNAGFICQGDGKCASACQTGASCNTSGIGGECGKKATIDCSTGSSICRAGPPELEVCDGLDNDCDGQIDDGSNLCLQGRMCRNGLCSLITF